MLLARQLRGVSPAYHTWPCQRVRRTPERKGVCGAGGGITNPIMTVPSDDLLHTWLSVIRTLDREALLLLRTKLSQSDGTTSHLLREIDAELSLRPPEADES